MRSAGEEEVQGQVQEEKDDGQEDRRAPQEQGLAMRSGALTPARPRLLRVASP